VRKCWRTDAVINSGLTPAGDGLMKVEGTSRQIVLAEYKNQQAYARSPASHSCRRKGPQEVEKARESSRRGGGARKPPSSPLVGI
jgi:hypothetical protein